MSFLTPALRILANVSDHFTPTEVKQRKLDGLIKRRNELLESQSKWTPADSVELDRVVGDIKRVSRLLSKAG